MKGKIISVEAHDGDFKMVDIEFENRNVIMLSLESKLTAPLFAEIVREQLLPQTDSKRIYWQNGASLTLAEIAVILRTESTK